MSDELQSFVDSGNPPEAAEAQAAESVAETSAVTSESTTAEQPVAPAATPEPDESWTKAMAIDERRKRQQAQAEADALRAQLQALQQGKPEQRPDLFEDPEGFVSQMRNEMRGATYQVRVELSQEMMRTIKPDYDEKEAIFVDMAKEDPTLWQKLHVSSNPAKFAYDTADKAERFKAMENVDQYEAKIRASVEQKVRAQLEQEYASKLEQAGKLAGIKPSLASVRSAAKDVPEPSALDMSLKELLNGR